MLRRLMSVEKRPVCNKKKVSDDKFAKEMTQMISNDKLQNLQHKKRWAILQRILHRMSELPDGRLFKAHQYHCATTLHQLSIRLCPLYHQMMQATNLSESLCKQDTAVNIIRWENDQIQENESWK